MRALLTSGGITNATLQDALVDLLGKPIAEADVLFVATGMYPFPGGSRYAWDAIGGTSAPVMAGLGWKSLGILELTALPHLDEDAWVPAVREADALLVWGGDPLFLATWMGRSGLAELLPTLRPEAVYVGTSAGSIAATTTFAETYVDPPHGVDGVLSTEKITFGSPQGDVDRLLVTGRGVGLVDFAVIPHLDNPHHPDASFANAGTWASHIPAPTYAIDDASAVKVVDGVAEVVGEGQWKLFQP